MSAARRNTIVQPMLDENKELLGEKAEINV